MSKIIVYGEESRKSLKAGVDAVGDAVRSTIGPKGRNVAFDRGWGGPTITNDGASIAREIVLKNPMQNMGANLAKEAAEKTNSDAGDGTTTSVVLMQAIISEGMRKIELGVNAVGVRNGLEKAAQVAIAELKKIAKPIKTGEETIQVATISAESAEIGQIIADTISKLGEHAVITVEESPTVGVTSEVSQGMEFDRGFISPYLATDPERMEAEYKDVPILVTDMKIGSVKEIVPFLEKVMSTGKKEVVIIADDVVGDALSTFIMNKMRGVFSILAVKAPGFGNRKAEYLQDIAALTGATVISNETGMKLEQIELTDLGSASRVVSTKDKTTIVGGKGDEKIIKSRIAHAKKELETQDSKHDQLKTEERIAKLSGGIGVIKVGAATETATKYLKLKVEDAVNAVKAALEEGIVAGGGSALLTAAIAIRKEIAKPTDLHMTTDEIMGFSILASSLEAPLKYIAINAGQGDGSKVVETVKEMGKNAGYDALKGVYVEDMIVAGIIDPVKVTRSAIENSVSTAGILLTTEVAMVEEPKEEKTV